MIAKAKPATKAMKEYSMWYVLPGSIGGLMMGLGVFNCFLQPIELRTAWASVFFAGLAIYFFGLWRMTRMHAHNLSVLLDEVLDR